MRTPVALYLLALAVRAGVFALFPDPAYPDSTYYVEVARSIASGHGLNTDFIWIFAEVGNRIPSPAVLPVPSNAHWLPLASFIQAPFVTLLGPTALASALPGILIGSLAAPLTWLIARDMGASGLVAAAAGVLVAIPGTATVFMAQPETFPLTIVLVPLALWCVGRGLRGDARAFALSGIPAGLLALARNDGVLLMGAIGLVWLVDRLRWLLARSRPRAWARVERRPIPVIAAIVAVGLFLVLIGPWWARQLAEFGSISPTSSSGAALWIRSIDEWNSITAAPSLSSFLAQGIGPIVASRLSGLTAALSIFAVLVSSVVLVPFLLIGAFGRRHSPDVAPWFAYTFVVFAGATLLYPLHVPGGTFIHTAIGLVPQAAILSVEGVVRFVHWIAGRRARWDVGMAERVLVWGVTAIVLATAVMFGGPSLDRWRDRETRRLDASAALDAAGAARTDRVMSIDAGATAYWTGHPGVVTTNDPLPTLQAIATAYDIRWLVLEREEVATYLAPVLEGGPRPSWIGPARYSLPSPDGGPPQVALYPVCVQPGDARCSGG